VLPTPQPTCDIAACSTQARNRHYPTALGIDDMHTSKHPVPAACIRRAACG
jgi:hypothetical protein